MDYPFEEFVTCSEGCMLCENCFADQIVAGLKDGKISTECIHKECKGMFTESAVQRAMKGKEEDLERLDKLRANEVIRLFKPEEEDKEEDKEKKIIKEKKDLGTLAECPFCEFFCIMENSNDIELKCQNPKCLKISCRKCKLETHIPERCKSELSEAEEEFRKFVEEEMSIAIIRRCKKCKKPQIKESGCNFVKCSCGSAMCYICRDSLTDAEHTSHFKNNNNCILYDGPAKDEERAREAKEKAIEKWRNLHPEFVDAKINVTEKQPDKPNLINVNINNPFNNFNNPFNNINNPYNNIKPKRNKFVLPKKKK
jgi:TRIAD3 protein (E3 ubiquitin-protein ligase RNF216)